MFGRPDVHRTVDQHIEAQAAAGAELEDADATLCAIFEDHASDATQRTEVAGKPREIGSIDLSPVYSHQRQYGNQVSGCSWM